MKPALKHCPDKKEIIFPVWRDERKHLFSIKDILGAFAMWAVRQSPYICPSNIEIAIKELAFELPKQIEFDSERFDFAEVSCDEIREAIDKCFDHIDIIKMWNQPKSGHNAPFVFCGRYSKPIPDDDIIDLNALSMNISHSLIAERLLEEDQTAK